MPELKVKASNNRKTPEFKVYSLNTRDYHEKIREFEGEGTIELEKGSYKVKAIDGERPYEEVVILGEDTELELDFAERYPENIKDGMGVLKKAFATGLILVVAVLGLYFTGNLPV